MQTELGKVRRDLGLVRRSPRGPPRAQPGWRGIPTYNDWIADFLLTSDLLRSALAERWLRETRRRYLDGQPQAQQVAHIAAGPVAFAASLRDLERLTPAG
jgi:hypothetical protein